MSWGAEPDESRETPSEIIASLDEMPLDAYFSRLRRTIDAAIAAADAGFASESDDDEPYEFMSSAAREFADVATKLRKIRKDLD